MAKEESRETDITSHIKEYMDKYGGVLLYPLSPRPSANSIWDSNTCKWIDYKTEERFEEECRKRLLGEIEPNAKTIQHYLSRQLGKTDGRA